MNRSLIHPLSLLVLAIAMLVPTGCGVGESTAEGQIATTADDYLRALSAGDTGAACAQLTATARAALERPCALEMQAIKARVGTDALTAAADEGATIDVDGNRGSAEIANLSAARLELVKVGEHWKIASGHRLE
jgi:hypothetical protein